MKSNELRHLRRYWSFEFVRSRDPVIDELGHEAPVRIAQRQKFELLGCLDGNQ